MRSILYFGRVAGKFFFSYLSSGWGRFIHFHWYAPPSVFSNERELYNTVPPLFSSLYFVDTGIRTGYENMECDRRLLEAFSDGSFQRRYGEGCALWRLYGWRPHAISLGYSQDAEAIDAERCRQEGIDVVRRPTGGRAVLHADEFTYSFFADSCEPNAELYRSVHEVIRLALLELGVTADFCRSALPSAVSGGSSLPAACFSASARSELQVMGRKLVGSAQRRSEGLCFSMVLFLFPADMGIFRTILRFLIPILA